MIEQNDKELTESPYNKIPETGKLEKLYDVSDVVDDILGEEIAEEDKFIDKENEIGNKNKKSETDTTSDKETNISSKNNSSINTPNSSNTQSSNISSKNSNIKVVDVDKYGELGSLKYQLSALKKLSGIGTIGKFKKFVLSTGIILLSPLKYVGINVGLVKDYQMGLINIAHRVKGNQIGLFLNFAKKVGRNQSQFIGMQSAKKVGWNQSQFIGMQSAKKVGWNQKQFIGMQGAKKVGSNQKQFIGIQGVDEVDRVQTQSIGIQGAKKVSSHQIQAIGIQGAKKVGDDQSQGVGLQGAGEVNQVQEQSIGLQGSGKAKRRKWMFWEY